jgi:hypothetical protein
LRLVIGLNALDLRLDICHVYYSERLKLG